MAYEIQRFAAMSPRPLSMQDVLDMLEPERLAKYMHVELPIRYSERIRWMEEIPDWEQIPELVAAHDKHCKSFRELRLVKRRPTLEAFTEVIRDVVDSQRNVQHELAFAMNRLHLERGSEYGSTFA